MTGLLRDYVHDLLVPHVSANLIYVDKELAPVATDVQRLMAGADPIMRLRQL